MGEVVLDAGVVIGWLEPADVHHVAARRSLERHAADRLVLPASAYAEVLVGAVRRGQVTKARRRIAALDVKIGHIAEATAEAAARLRARNRALRLPDALVLGHAEAVDADAVLTTDDRWLAVSPRARLVS